MPLEEKYHNRRPALTRSALLGGILAMLVLVLAVFGEVLFTPGPDVLSMFGTDLSDQFVYTRFFGFQELRQGNIPLWNPYFFCGIPFLGLFQEALLYPFSLFFLCLPLAVAMNWSIVFHVFLLGLFMYLWAGYHGRLPLSALLAGILAMFGGATYLHIFAGHLSLICALPWAALIFLTIDGGWAALSKGGLENQGRWASFPLWWGIGAVSVCFQVLAGHPQTVFVTSVAAVIYVVCKVAGDVRKWRLLVFLAAIYLTGAVLSAVQLMAGMAANLDSVRGGGVFYKFAAMFSFPPENFLTLIVPGFFGDMHFLPYWGRCYLWEMNLFLSVTGFVLLAAGIVWSVKIRQLTWLVVAGILIVLALGKNTPFFHLLYAGVPGFDLFRGSSKFMLPAFLFMAMLAAFGYDCIERSDGIRASLVLFCLGISLLLLTAALFLWQQEGAATPNCLWGKFLQRICATQEGYLPYHHYQRSDFSAKAVWLSRMGLITSSALFFVVGAMLRLAGKSRLVKYFVFLLAAGELVVFARHYQPTFDINRCFPAALAQTFSSMRFDDRVLNIGSHNAGMRYRISDLWGKYPGVRRRYAELMAFAQGYEPENANQYLRFRKNTPVFGMLRCGAIIEDGPDGKKRVQYSQAALPRAFLVGSYKVLSDRNEILRYVTSAAFNPLREVVLESEPDPGPRAFQTDLSDMDVTILDTTTDTVDITVNTPQPAILVVTDTFSQGWQAVSLEKTAVQDYVIMPANYALRAIPLEKGQHKIRLIYQPSIIKTGLLISVAGWALLLLSGLLLFVSRHRRLGRHSADEQGAVPCA